MPQEHFFISASQSRATKIKGNKMSKETYFILFNVIRVQTACVVAAVARATR